MRKIIGGIYAIIHEPTERLYIGSTVDFHNRKLGHFRELRKGVHPCKYLQRVWNKYGEDQFVFVILEEIQLAGIQRTRNHLDVLCQREQEYFDRLSTEFELFNSLKTATISGGHKGHKHSESAKQKMSTARLGKPLSPIVKAAVVSALMNRSNEIEQKRRTALIASLKRSVVCLDTGEKFESVTDAAEKTKAPSTSIVRVCKKERISAGGFHWVYADDPVQSIRERKSRGKGPVECSNGETYSSITDASHILGINSSQIGAACAGKAKMAGGLRFRFIDKPWAEFPNKKLSPEHRRKIADGNRGKKYNEETLCRMSKAAKAREERKRIARLI